MPRVSRSAAQRYANAARKKPKERGERHASILPPVTGQAPIELPGGLAAPQPLEFAADDVLLREERRQAAAPPAAPAPSAPPPARAARALTPRGEIRTASRAEMRHAARRAGAAPIVDYSYVRGDLRRITVVFGVLVVVLAALTFVPGLQ